MVRKRRSESFFGIHFDFHAMPGEVVPTVWRPEVYAEMLDAVKPDFVQCDTKGHAGYSSYPTNAGTRAAMQGGIDILRMMRDETAKRGIALYAHHSGIYDQKAGELHPDWCVVDVNGKVDTDHMSAFGPFVDELLLPQLRELAGEYGLDGAWIDGECWGTRLDYSHWATDAYKARYQREAPRPGDDDYEGYREFCREGFRAYVKHYVDVIKSEYPEFQITSNWIWSAYMPEKADVDVDFLSGDYSSTNSVCSARYHGRIIEARNKPWDLIAWGHNAIPCSWMTHNRNTKELGQYCQEASMIIAMGGCFEFFNIHYGIGGTVQQWAIPIWAKTASYCRERSSCFGARIRKELGILFPNDRNAPNNAMLYGGAPGGPQLNQWIDLLQDCQYSTKVLLEHQIIEDDLSDYRAIVIPGAGRLDEAAVSALEAYVRKGGKLLVDGMSSKWFEGMGGFEAAEGMQQLIFVDGGGALATGETWCVPLRPTTGTACGHRHVDNIYESSSEPAGILNELGDGKICTLTFSLGAFATLNRSSAIRRFTKNMLEGELGYVPSVCVEGSRFADVTVTQKSSGEVLVNLINMAGEHNVANVRSYDEIPAIGPLTVTFEAGMNVKSVTTIPEGCDLETKVLEDGRTQVVVDRLDIHCALCVK